MTDTTFRLVQISKKDYRNYSSDVSSESFFDNLQKEQAEYWYLAIENKNIQSAFEVLQIEESSLSTDVLATLGDKNVILSTQRNKQFNPSYLQSESLEYLNIPVGFADSADDAIDNLVYELRNA